MRLTEFHFTTEKSPEEFCEQAKKKLSATYVPSEKDEGALVLSIGKLFGIRTFTIKAADDGLNIRASHNLYYLIPVLSVAALSLVFAVIFFIGQTILPAIFFVAVALLAVGLYFLNILISVRFFKSYTTKKDDIDYGYPLKY